MAQTMSGLKIASSRTEKVGLAVSLLAAAAGGAMGFGFGMRVGGIVVALMSAACAATMAAFLVDAVYDVWERRTTSR